MDAGMYLLGSISEGQKFVKSERESGRFLAEVRENAFC